MPRLRVSGARAGAKLRGLPTGNRLAGPESLAFSLRLAAHLLCRFQSIVRFLSPPPSLPSEEHQYSCINLKTAQKADSPLSAPRAFFFLGPSAGLAPQRVPGGAVNAALCAARQPQHPRPPPPAPRPHRLRSQLTLRPRPRPRPPLAAWPAEGPCRPCPRPGTNKRLPPPHACDSGRGSREVPGATTKDH